MTERKRILILTPSADVASLITEALAPSGALISQVVNPYRFLASFLSAPTDILFVDAEGLRQEELEMIRVLREMRPDVGCVALVNPDQRAMAAGLFCSGADLYLLKPVEAPEILVAVERVSIHKKLAALRLSGADRPSTISRFALGVAHEINNPLTTISGWLQMLAADRTGDEELSRTLRSMKEETDRVAEVVRRLLTFAQQEPPRKEDVDVCRVLWDLVPLHAPQCKSKGIDLAADIMDKPHRVVGDPEQLRQVFDSILTHAELALSNGGRISLKCGTRDNGIEIILRHDGPILPAERLERLFEPFQSGTRARGDANGLSTAFGIVRSHGGTLEAESSEAAGTRFVVWLPEKL